MAIAPVESLPSPPESRRPSLTADRSGSRRPTVTSVLIAVAGTRLWAEVRARKALEDVGLATVGADELVTQGPIRRVPDLVLLVRTENCPTATAREAQALAGLPADVPVVVAGRVGFHPFDHRVSVELPLERLASADLAVVAGEVRQVAVREHLSASRPRRDLAIHG